MALRRRSAPGYTSGMKNPTPVKGPGAAAALVLLGAALLAGCASVKAPTLQVQKLKLGGIGVTGVRMDVSFHVRNPNPEPLLIERFEYELSLNGRRLGRGYYPQTLDLAGFGDEQVVSRFDLNFLSLPGGVKRVLDRDRVQAKVKGKFYVRRGGDLKKLGFSSDAQVNLGR
jgi:LEA14-like dessication related protein